MAKDDNFMLLPIKVYLKSNIDGQTDYLHVPLPFYVNYTKKMTATRKLTDCNRLQDLYENSDSNTEPMPSVLFYNHVLSVLTEQVESKILGLEVPEDGQEAIIADDSEEKLGSDCLEMVPDEKWILTFCTEEERLLQDNFIDPPMDDNAADEPLADYDNIDDNIVADNSDCSIVMDNGISTSIVDIKIERVCDEGDDVVAIKSSPTALDTPVVKSPRQLRSVIKSKQSIKTEASKTGNSSNDKSSYPYKCTDCGMSYKNAHSLNRHQKMLCSALPKDVVFRNKQRSVCKECGKSFPTNQGLDNHINKIHLKIKTFKCGICDKSYYTNTMLKTHVSSSHSSEINHICELCGKGYKTNDAIRHHMRTSHVYDIHMCPICPVQLKSAYNLRSHMKIHGKQDKDFMCEICSKTFTESCRLRRHMGVHTGKKDNVCPECGKQFLAAYNLRVHMRIHSGEKPYKCDKCQRSFSQSVGLKVHVCRVGGKKSLKSLKSHASRQYNTKKIFLDPTCVPIGGTKRELMEQNASIVTKHIFDRNPDMDIKVFDRKPILEALYPRVESQAETVVSGDPVGYAIDSTAHIAHVCNTVTESQQQVHELQMSNLPGPFIF